MAEIIIERSCRRFRSEIKSEHDQLFRTTSLDDVKQAIHQVDLQLTARQASRNLGRLNPYIDAIDALDRYSKSIDVLSNAVPFMAYAWAPLRLILTAVQDYNHALDKLLSAYAQIGATLPRLALLSDAFHDDSDSRQLFAFLIEDIMEFHTRAYRLIQKPAWKVFFLASWGRFEHRFGSLIKSIEVTRNLIDQHATTMNILHVKEWREKSSDDAITREKRWESEQLQAVKNWLGAADTEQVDKLEWFRDQCFPGTVSWITKNAQFRSWMQRGRGNPVLWLHGKPGSGKSVLSSKVVSFIQSNPDDRVLFFFSDYHTPAYGTIAHIFRVFCAQILSFVPEIVPFFYDEYLSKNSSPSATVLKGALCKIFKNFGSSRLVVDGIDELSLSEHKAVINGLVDLTTSSGDVCKLLICSQDLPTIGSILSRRPKVFLGDERDSIQRDIGMVVEKDLDELNNELGAILDSSTLNDIKNKIMDKSEGMFLWVKLVTSLLMSSSSLHELESNIDSLPRGLEAVYGKILNNIHARCSSANLGRIRRIFEWLLFSKERLEIRKCEILIGTSLHKGCTAMDRSNLPFPNTLEICKPLIEETPGGSIRFVHSTVAQFLVHRASGPFTTSLSGHQSVAYACISHMIQAIDLIAFPTDPLVVRIGLGIYGLQTYASDYWVEHLLACVAEGGIDRPSLQDLIEQATRLAEKHSQFSPGSTNLPCHVDDCSTRGVDPRLELVKPFPLLHALIFNVLEYRKQLQSQQPADTTKSQDIPPDNTLFSRVRMQYHQGVQFVLTVDDFPGLLASELQVFRANYGQTAFVCHVHTCPRSRIGFASSQEIQNHLDRQHNSTLRCFLQGCAYNDIGFPSAKSLRAHQRRRHGKSGPPRVPNTITRKRKSDHLSGPDPPPLPTSFSSISRPELADFDDNPMPPQPDPNLGDGGLDFGSMDFAKPLTSANILESFDFDSFLPIPSR